MQQRRPAPAGLLRVLRRRGSEGPCTPSSSAGTRAGVEHLVLDLRGLSFIDSSGVRLAFDLHTEAAGDGLRLELVPGPPNVQRIFELTGTHDRLPFVTPERIAPDACETEPRTG